MAQRDPCIDQYILNINRMLQHGDSSDTSQCESEYFVSMEESIEQDDDDGPFSVDIQTSMIKSYYLLEFVGSLCAAAFLYSNIFMMATVCRDHGLSWYLLARLINLASLGVVAHLFTSPDTYRSVSIMPSFLMVNAVTHGYPMRTLALCLLMHLTGSACAAILVVVIFSPIIHNISSAAIMHDVAGMQLSYSFVLIAILVHAVTAVCLTNITSSTTSANASVRTLHKIMLVALMSATFGFAIGPVGYMLPSLLLYVALTVAREEYTLLSLNILAAYGASILVVLVTYPVIALQVKFVWRKRYVRYIEY